MQQNHKKVILWCNMPESLSQHADAPEHQFYLLHKTLQALKLECLCSTFGFYGCVEFNLCNAEEGREVLFLAHLDQYALSSE